MTVDFNALVNLISYFLTAVGSGVVGGAVIVFIIFYFPEKSEKWGSILFRLIYAVAKRGQKKIVALDIQGKVNEYVKSLQKESSNLALKGVSIQWVPEGEVPTSFYMENRLVIRMRHHSDQDKNLVYAMMVFISRVLLSKAKRYLSPSQKESLDLYVGRKLLQKEQPQLIERFFEDYFSPRALSSKKIMDLLENYGIIDKVGLFFPVLVQELTFLGEKVFYKRKSENIVVEVTNFIDFLKQYAKRETGSDETPTGFEGLYCRCGIVIVAKYVKRTIGDCTPYVNYVRELIRRRFENIYLIGSASAENQRFINLISDEVQKDLGLVYYKSKNYEAKIMAGGVRRRVDSYLVLLRSPDVERVHDGEYMNRFVDVPTDGE